MIRKIFFTSETLDILARACSRCDGLQSVAAGVEAASAEIDRNETGSSRAEAGEEEPARLHVREEGPRTRLLRCSGLLHGGQNHVSSKCVGDYD